MKQFKVRSMRLGEFNIVSRLVYDSVHTLCTQDYTKEELNAWVPENMSMPVFKRSISRCFAIVAVDENNKIIGFMSTEKDGYINRLYTHPEFVNMGVATTLLKTTEEWARKRKIKSLVLESSKTAEAFYKARGFEKTGEVISIKNNLRFVSAKMTKEL